MRFKIPVVIVAGLAILSLGFHEAAPTRIEQPAETAKPSVLLASRAENSTREPLVRPLDLPASDGPFASGAVHEFITGDRATFHPHGEQRCASGCAASRHPTAKLTRPRFQQLLTEYSVESIETPGPAFETLLYFGRQAAAWLERDGAGPLDFTRASLLRSELQRDYAEVSLRLADETGAVCAALPPTPVPLDRRHEFDLQPHNLQPLIASGTVKRVGRDHIWTRL